MGIIMDGLATDPDLRQVLEAACHEDPKQRATAAELLAMPFCSSNHPTILAWGKVRPPRAPQIELMKPPLRPLPPRLMGLG